MPQVQERVIHKTVECWEEEIVEIPRVQYIERLVEREIEQEIEVPRYVEVETKTSVHRKHVVEH